MVVVDTVAAAEGLIVRGTAEVIEDGAEEATIRNAVRYLGEKDGREKGAQINAGGPRVKIRITPKRLLYGI